MPRPPVQHQGLARLQHERAHVVEIGGGRESIDAGATASTDAHVERRERLRVGVVTEHHRAAQAGAGGVDLVGGVLDGVEVGVVPLEVQRVLAVGGVGVGTRHPSEGRPGRRR